MRTKSTVFYLVVSVVGMGCSQGLVIEPDGFVTTDLSPATDMATAPVGDLAGTQTAQYVVSQLKLPTSSSTDAYDLDGDGTGDDRLGSIIQALVALNLNAQSGTDAAISAGTLVMLISETSNDPMQYSALGAKTDMLQGKATTTPPTFSGTDMFTIDTTTPPGDFTGDIALGTFNSAATATAVTPVQLTIALPLFPAAPPLLLPVTAAHIVYTRTPSGNITGGQLNAAITQTTIDTVLYPALATLLTAQVQMPGASATIKMFDTNMDGTVTAAELMGNALIANFLAPDVQLFQGGVFKPNPAKTTKDSLSIGLSFLAVPATF